MQVFCHTPAVALVRAVGRKRAMKMLLTGRSAAYFERGWLLFDTMLNYDKCWISPIDAPTAASYGLINSFVNQGEFLLQDERRI